MVDYHNNFYGIVMKDETREEGILAWEAFGSRWAAGEQRHFAGKRAGERAMTE